MRVIPIAKVGYLLALLLLLCSMEAQTKGGRATPREFVEAFYRWYVPHALSETSTTASDLALKYKSSSFSPELATLLKEDSEAQAECGEIIGIDFDPFLDSQDPAGRYEVGQITRKGQNYRADIYSEQSGTRSEKPALVAELSERNGHWIFVNFYYPEGADLLAILRSPRPACSAPRPRGKKLDAPGGSE